MLFADFCRILCRTSVPKQKMPYGSEYPTFVAIEAPQDTPHQIFSALLES